MQNAMLDSIVSSNSQELFDFNAIHNGEHCIASLDPKDRGTERQFRFTRALLCTLLGVKSENTITNHIDALINRGVVNDVKNLTSLNIKNEKARRISRVSDMIHVDMSTSTGAVKTTLYNLNVLNQLAMVWQRHTRRPPRRFERSCVLPLLSSRTRTANTHSPCMSKNPKLTNR